MATETLARGSRGQDWRGWFLNLTERCPSRCMRVKVHQSEGLSTDFFFMLGHALCRFNSSFENQPLTTDSEKWERTFWMRTKRKKSVGDFEKWYPSKAPSMTFEDPERMNA